jgi:hypothetical protein
MASSGDASGLRDFQLRILPECTTRPWCRTRCAGSARTRRRWQAAMYDRTGRERLFRPAGHFANLIALAGPPQATETIDLPPPDSPADAVDEADLSASTVAWARLLHSRKTRFTNTDRLRTRPPATTRRLRSLAAGRTFTPGPGSATRSLNASARGSTRATTRATKTSSSRSTTPTGTAASSGPPSPTGCCSRSNGRS